MSTIIVQQEYHNVSIENQHESLGARFLNWLNQQEKYRVGWVGMSLMFMTAIFFPVTMAAILIHGGNFKLIIGAMFSLILVLVPNLAALPTRYTLPAFFTAMLIDLVIIATSFFI